MGKLRVAVIGTGSISNCHMDAYHKISDRVEVVAGCDIDSAKLKAWGERHGVTNLYTDYNKMLEEIKPDCVSVTTWNAVHKDATVAALLSGANVICEKPMAMNAKEAEEMVAARDKSGKLLQIGFVRRGFHGFQKRRTDRGCVLCKSHIPSQKRMPRRLVR